MIRVKENQIYKISGFIKSQNIGTQNNGASLMIEKSSAKTRMINGTTKDWEYVELYGKTVKNQATIELSLAIGGYGSLNTGKAWFDDIKVEMIDKVPGGTGIVSLDTDLDPNKTTVKTPQEKKILPIIIISSIFIVCVIFIFLILFRKKSNIKKDISNSDDISELLDVKCKKVKINKRDILIMAVVSLIYLILALYKLGSLSVPTTYWTPSMTNEYFTIDLGKEVNLSRISNYSGLGSDREADGRFIVDYMDNNGKYKYLTTIEKKHIFILEHVNTPDIKTRKLRFTVEEAGGSINEFAIYEKGSYKPIKGVKITDYDIQESKKQLNNLFDEQDKMDYVSNYYNSMYFDEIYHARTAFEFIHGIIPYENTHPPLGKVIMAIGIIIFGMVPFGWRIAGTLVGVAMLPAMYVFGKKMFNKSIYGFTAMLSLIHI